MENYSQTPNIFNITIDDEAKAHLLETVRWTKFIAIIGFVMLALMLLFAFLLGTGFSAMSQMSGLGSSFGFAMMILYVLLALLYFFPIYYLYKFSILIKPAINTGNQEQFNLALSYQRRMYKFIGILFLIVLCLYAIMLIFGVLGAALSGL